MTTPARKGPPLAHPTSLGIAALRLGETFSQVVRIDGDQITKDKLREATEDLKNTMNGFVGAAKRREGADYATATFTTWTKSFDLLVGITVTRTA